MEKIGVTHIGTVTAQGTEEERREMLRSMGGGLRHRDTQEVEMLQARVAELEAERDAMVAGAYEAAAMSAEDNCEPGMYCNASDAFRSGYEDAAGHIAAAIRSLTPADSKAALDHLINERVQAALAAQGPVTVKPLPLMREAVRFTEIRPGVRQMVFRFRNTDELNSADDEWLAFVAALTTAQSNAEGGGK